MKLLKIAGYAFVIYLVVGTIIKLTKQPKEVDKEPQEPKWNVN